MTILDHYSTPSMALTVKERIAPDGDVFVCVTGGGEELCVNLHSGATSNPLNLEDIIGKRVWVEWLQPYEWIAQAPHIYHEEEEKK